MRQWLAARALPPKAAIAVRAGIPTRGTLTLLSELSQRWAVPVTFIGDLRPFDLTIYSTLQHGAPSLRRPKGWNLPLRYGGVHDPWLALCRASCRKEINFDQLLIGMSAVESRHLEVIERVLPELEELLGANALGLLRAGRSFHLEGACQPAVYRRGFTRALTRMLTASPQ